MTKNQKVYGINIQTFNFTLKTAILKQYRKLEIQKECIILNFNKIKKCKELCQ